METEKVVKEFGLKEHQLRFTSTVAIDSCDNPEAFFSKTKKDLEEYVSAFHFVYALFQIISFNNIAGTRVELQNTTFVPTHHSHLQRPRNTRKCITDAYTHTHARTLTLETHAIACKLTNAQTKRYTYIQTQKTNQYTLACLIDVPPPLVCFSNIFHQGHSYSSPRLIIFRSMTSNKGIIRGDTLACK